MVQLALNLSCCWLVVKEEKWPSASCVSLLHKDAACAVWVRVRVIVRVRDPKGKLDVAVGFNLHGCHWIGLCVARVAPNGRNFWFSATPLKLQVFWNFSSSSLSFVSALEKESQLAVARKVQKFSYLALLACFHSWAARNYRSKKAKRERQRQRQTEFVWKPQDSHFYRWRLEANKPEFNYTTFPLRIIIEHYSRFDSKNNDNKSTG